jgi:GTP-binding protein Era
VEVEAINRRRVSASVVVETRSQKRILVGKGGSMIREIGARARPEIELLLGHSVFLDLHVKVQERWRRDRAFLERLGM